MHTSGGGDRSRGARLRKGRKERSCPAPSGWVPGPEAPVPGVASPSLPVLRGLWREARGPLGSLHLRSLQRHLCCVQGVPHASRSHLSPHLECPLPLHTHHCPHSPCGLPTLKISLKGASSNHTMETCSLQETNRSVYFLPSICHYQAQFCLLICLLSEQRCQLSTRRPPDWSSLNEVVCSLTHPSCSPRVGLAPRSHVCVQPLSRVRLLVTPWTIALQAPLSMGFLRQEY